MMGHLGDVLHALLTADAVLTDVTQWSSFPRESCFSLFAHTFAAAPTAAAATTMGTTVPAAAPAAAQWCYCPSHSRDTNVRP